MWHVYILYSAGSGRTYTGFTNDLERPLHEHTFSSGKGYTLRYRPWALIHSETFREKSEAMQRERFYKTGKGREEIKKMLGGARDGAVSASAEKD